MESKSCGSAPVLRVSAICFTAIGKASIISSDKVSRAVLFLVLFAALAFETSLALCTDPNTIAYGHALYGFSNTDDSTDNLVPNDNRVIGRFPTRLEMAHIASTNSTMADFDVDVVSSERFRLVFFPLHVSFDRGWVFGDPSFETVVLGHGSDMYDVRQDMESEQRLGAAG
jgi:hypothetical protein